MNSQNSDYQPPRNPLSVDTTCPFITERAGCISPARLKKEMRRPYVPCDSSHCPSCPKYLRGIALKT